MTNTKTRFCEPTVKRVLLSDMEPGSVILDPADPSELLLVTDQKDDDGRTVLYSLLDGARDTLWSHDSIDVVRVEIVVRREFA